MNTSTARTNPLYAHVSRVVNSFNTGRRPARPITQRARDQAAEARRWRQRVRELRNSVATVTTREDEHVNVAPVPRAAPTPFEENFAALQEARREENRVAQAEVTTVGPRVTGHANVAPVPRASPTEFEENFAALQEVLRAKAVAMREHLRTVGAVVKSNNRPANVRSPVASSTVSTTSTTTSTASIVADQEDLAAEVDAMTASTVQNAAQEDEEEEQTAATAVVRADSDDHASAPAIHTAATNAVPVNDDATEAHATIAPAASTARATDADAVAQNPLERKPKRFLQYIPAERADEVEALVLRLMAQEDTALYDDAMLFGALDCLAYYTDEYNEAEALEVLAQSFRHQDSDTTAASAPLTQMERDAAHFLKCIPADRARHVVALVERLLAEEDTVPYDAAMLFAALDRLAYFTYYYDGDQALQDLALTFRPVDNSDTSRATFFSAASAASTASSIVDNEELAADDAVAVATAHNEAQEHQEEASAERATDEDDVAHDLSSTADDDEEELAAPAAPSTVAAASTHSSAALAVSTAQTVDNDANVPRAAVPTATRQRRGRPLSESMKQQKKAAIARRKKNRELEAKLAVVGPRVDKHHVNAPPLPRASPTQREMQLVEEQEELRVKAQAMREHLRTIEAVMKSNNGTSRSRRSSMASTASTVSTTPSTAWSDMDDEEAAEADTTTQATTANDELVSRSLTTASTM